MRRRRAAVERLSAKAAVAARADDVPHCGLRTPWPGLAGGQEAACAACCCLLINKTPLSTLKTSLHDIDKAGSTAASSLQGLILCYSLLRDA